MSSEIYQLLEEKFIQFNQTSFIENDPISIPHLFSAKEDIEIAGFLAATIAWGQRKTIVTNARKMIQLMDDAPYDFILHHEDKDLWRLKGFVHRTFNSEDFEFFVKALQHIYINHGGLESVFARNAENMQQSIHYFKKVFFEIEHPQRSTKHIADPLKKSSAKRINMFLRWMCRNDKSGVDFGIWKSISPKHLMCPLDVHSGNVARKLGLLTRTQNDWQAVEELTYQLRKFDKNDPVKYDFSLFGLGVFEGF
ncbi:MAG TPA: TIGR02757 family protein [Vicingaceae bacterium]|jgi:uncharacterized protein (TIGR02757 family)|nr:TIGR02757 family protein [Vicingaceae bacterium]